jgi:hypothetical protein
VLDAATDEHDAGHVYWLEAYAVAREG